MITIRIPKIRTAAAEEDAYGGQLMDELSQIKDALENVRRQYEDVCADDLIEALIYEELSLRARYRFLIKEAKGLQGTQ